MPTIYGTNLSITLDPVDCPACHCWFGVDAAQIMRLRASKERFYCPAGHPMSYTESETDKLKRHLKFAERDADNARIQAANERRQKIAAKSALTKTKNRIARGVCPCCNRTFVNLQRHVLGQHPDFDSSAHLPAPAEIDKKVNQNAKVKKAVWPAKNRHQKPKGVRNG